MIELSLSDLNIRVTTILWVLILNFKTMKNILKGYFSSILGVIIILCDVAYFFGIISLPEYDGVTFQWRVTIAFIVGFILFFIPPAYIERVLKRIINLKLKEHEDKQ